MTSRQKKRVPLCPPVIAMRYCTECDILFSSKTALSRHNGNIHSLPAVERKMMRGDKAHPSSFNISKADVTRLLIETNGIAVGVSDAIRLAVITSTFTGKLAPPIEVDQKDKILVSLSLSPTFTGYINTVSYKAGISRSEYIRRTMRWYLESKQHERLVDAFEGIDAPPKGIKITTGEFDMRKPTDVAALAKLLNE